jgi:hypothetical protein
LPASPGRSAFKQISIRYSAAASALAERKSPV